MNLDSPVPVKDQKEKQDSFIEVVNLEKQLWGLVHLKGLLHTDVQDFFRKVRSDYEKIILKEHEVVELQVVEYSLWKLHYKHIDEFRKSIRKSSASSDDGKTSNMDSHSEGFKSFLTEAAEFYHDLIAKLRRSCGLPEEPLYCKKAGLEAEKWHKCQFLCYRFLICLGDLARYSELCKNPDFGNRNWSFAASYYFKATMIWPDGGNPQNQLALLATYVGDDFLALYHCVRSLAVKEPFPDAWNNLILLFEKNRLTPLDSLSSEADFDFLKPSERSVSQIESQSNKDPPKGNGLEATEHVSCAKNDLWPLFVRMTSFFFIESSLEHFPCSLASTVRELEALVTLEDTKLKAELESYQHMDSARTGPYRALQTVSILIFVIHNQKESPELKESKEKTTTQKTTLTQLAFTTTFIFMGRLLERCLKSNFLDCCPILPSVLVFVEWLAGMIDEVEETCGNDEKVLHAMSYFFGTFVGFLDRLGNHESEVNPHDHMALWEDVELRGFAPIADAHVSLDFETHVKNLNDSSGGNVCRAHRIFQASMKIMERSKDSQKWFLYDKLERKFYTEESEREIRGGNQSHQCGNGKSSATEEEEVILFKPITRYNSAPICTSIATTDKISTEGGRDEKTSSDECLRRASSLFIGNKPSKQPEPLLKESPMYPAGHPSLSAWVLDKESVNIEREKGRKEFSKNDLSPIEEIPTHFSSLSLNETDHQDSIFGYSSPPPPYLAPIPSAPLLPDDAIWYSGNSSNFSEPNSEVTNGILGASPLISRIPGLIDQHPPLGMMSSSEWLHHYTNNQNLSRAFSVPGNFNGHDASRFDVFDQWGNVLASNQLVYLESPRLLPCPPLTYGADEHRREKLFIGYQRPSPYVCGGGTELRVEQPPLLHYLKEREWQLQRESQVRGPTYMGN